MCALTNRRPLKKFFPWSCKIWRLTCLFIVTTPADDAHMGYSVIALADRLRTEADAYLFVEQLRWHGVPVSPHCDHEGATYIEPLNGISRKTRTGAASQRRVWRCWSCRKQFSVLTGTVFHGTKI